MHRLEAPLRVAAAERAVMDRWFQVTAISQDVPKSRAFTPVGVAAATSLSGMPQTLLKRALGLGPAVRQVEPVIGARGGASGTAPPANSTLPRQGIAHRETAS
ncbi:MAG: hypothetical protein KatS3mg060_1213 [Dehalococcoidia bacterium]|nr:MAG: hypothetical protein KatS3mg060_1213 [Dehalococcoidia bacterium]